MAREWERDLRQDTSRMISSQRNASPLPIRLFNSEQYLEILLAAGIPDKTTRQEYKETYAKQQLAEDRRNDLK